MPETFGEWIREARESRRYTARECAVRAGLKESVWSNWENDRTRRNDGGPTQPRPDTLRKIALGLRIDEWEVFDAAGYMPKPPDGATPLWSYSGPGPIRNDPNAEREEGTLTVHDPDLRRALLNPDFADDPILEAMQALYRVSSPEARPLMLGEVTKIATLDQNRQIAHGKREETAEENSLRIEELKRIQQRAQDEIKRRTEAMKQEPPSDADTSR